MQTAAYALSGPVTPFPPEAVYPARVERNAWIVPRYSDVVGRRSTVFFEGDSVTYSYPLAFLDDVKDTIYTNGGTAVFR